MLFTSACKTHRHNLKIEKLSVSFSGGNNYPKASNKGGFAIGIKSDTSISSLKRFDVYSPIRDPLIITVIKKNDTVVIKDEKGNEFALGSLDKSEADCNYHCKLVFTEGDKVSFTSSLALFRYWHGFSALGGLPLLMRYHYYTLKIKKKGGESLKAEWKYSVYKYKPYNGRSRIWSGDYCEDSGGGLTKLKIKN